jgi:hypothetical protein
MGGLSRISTFLGGSHDNLLVRAERLGRRDPNQARQLAFTWLCARKVTNVVKRCFDLLTRFEQISAQIGQLATVNSPDNDRGMKLGFQRRHSSRNGGMIQAQRGRRTD